MQLLFKHSTPSKLLLQYFNKTSNIQVNNQYLLITNNYKQRGTIIIYYWLYKIRTLPIVIQQSLAH